MKNFIFFDIDGTIISEDGYLPESAVRAIQAARKKGNATLINTGRTAMNVDPFLREIGFDGATFTAAAQNWNMTERSCSTKSRPRHAAVKW